MAAINRFRYIPKPFQFNSSSYYSSSSDYPTGEFVFKPVTGFIKFLVKLKTLVAFPKERIQHGSVLDITLRGEISDHLNHRLSLPKISDNLLKAAYDPRISRLYLQIGDLSCGWAILDEIHRQILNFRKSGKWAVAYLPSIRHKTYYIACACDEIYAPPCAYIYLFGFALEAPFLRGVYDKLGIEPQVVKTGKYLARRDEVMCKTMSEDVRESMNALVDGVHSNWLDKVSSARGKKREDIENFINEGVYQVKRLEEDGLITGVLYDYEILIRLKERLQVKLNKYLPVVYFR